MADNMSNVVCPMSTQPTSARWGNTLFLDFHSKLPYLIKCHVTPVAPALPAVFSFHVLARPSVPVLPDPLRVLNLERRYVLLEIEGVCSAHCEGALLDLAVPVSTALPDVEDYVS